MKNTFLQIKNINVSFKVEEDIIKVLHDINLTIDKNDSIAIIGESGSGKSVLSKTICGILPPNLNEIDGQIIFENEEVEIGSGINKNEIGIVLQNPMQTFNPTIKIKTFMRDVFFANAIEDDENDSKKIGIINELGISDPEIVLEKYPHELSGGMLQRLAIGITLAKKPRILICDEPTSSLDIIMQKRIIDLIKDKKAKYNFALIFITHDISIIKNLCTKVVVMRNGKILEAGNIDQTFDNPNNLYTKKLIEASTF